MKHQLLQRYRFKDILHPLIQDLRNLFKEGILVSVNGQEIKLKCALATISADNLSAHNLAGFTCCFSSGRVCRFCMVTYQDLKSHVNEDNVIIRSSEVHKYHLSALREIGEISKKTYGVVNECPFNDLEYFDVTKSFPPDLMHDFLEGIVPLVITKVIKALHFSEIVSLSNINAELEAFQIGKNDKRNIPQKFPQSVLKQTRLLGTAAQNWCLFRILPFLIGHYIPQGEAHWAVYLKCREIGEIILSPCIKKTVIPFLSLLIGEFLSDFQALFPDTFPPKLHFLTHYPRLISDFGPLKSLWCMRFEGKHQYFKRLARNTCNFRNLCNTLSKRHQLRQCWELTSLDALPQQTYTEGERSVPFRSFPCDLKEGIRNKSRTKDIPSEETLAVVNSLLTNNTKYKIGDSFVIDVAEDGIPVFMKVSKIVQFRAIWLIFGKLLIPQKFDYHNHAFLVQEERKWVVIHPGEEKDHHALDTYKHDDDVFITLHHSVNL